MDDNFHTYDEVRPPGKTDVEIIDGAIDLISRDRGWCKGSFCANNATNEPYPDGRPRDLDTISFCIEGAVIESASGAWTTAHHNTAHWNYGFMLAAKVGRLMAERGIVEGTLPRNFNDHNSTSQEDAILYLKTAREELANAES